MPDYEYDTKLPTDQLELQAEQIHRNIRYMRNQTDILNRQIQYETGHLIAIQSELAMRDKDTGVH